MFYFIRKINCQKITWIASNILWRIFLRFRVIGRENISDLKQGGIVFVANHGNGADAFMIGSCLPARYWRYMPGLRFFTYYKHIDHKWYGPLIRLSGAYPVYSGPGRGGLEDKLRQTLDFIRAGYSIVMFPVGRRLPELDPKEARPGAGYIAKELNPVFVPVYIHGSYRIGWRELIRRQRRVTMVFGAPFRYTERIGPLTGEYAQIAARIMQEVKKLEGKARQ